MLLELAIGDAHGAGFEYADEQIVLYNTLAGYVQHSRHNIAPGQYTDDTQMSIAVAEAIISGEPWTSKLLADAFVLAFRRDPRDGYARGFQAFTGDVDTVATIALAAASCSEEYEKDLPPQLVVSLENGRYGREYLTELDVELLASVTT